MQYIDTQDFHETYYFREPDSNYWCRQTNEYTNCYYSIKYR